MNLKKLATSGAALVALTAPAFLASHAHADTNPALNSAEWTELHTANDGGSNVAYVDKEVPNYPANNGDNRSIGERYGAIVKKHDIINKLLKQLKDNPWNRRNVISLWDYEAFDQSDGLLPCAFQVMFDVRQVDDTIYLDATLTQRSNDMLVAHHINAMQYVALQLMIAKHFGWRPGNFYYFVNNLHIYDNQFEQAKELLKRTPSSQNPKLILDVPDGTNFYDITADDFKLINYNPVKPQLTFDLAI